MEKSTIGTKSQTLLLLFFFTLLLNSPRIIISAARSLDFPAQNSLSSNAKFTTITTPQSLTNERSTMIVNPKKLAATNNESEQQYMVAAHDVPSGANPISNGSDEY
nr:CLAVATA3/ESR (CLE)-related protein 41 [Nicotiana tomentosiformis]